MGFLIRELLDAGLLHDDVRPSAAQGLQHYTEVPELDGDKLVWDDAPAQSARRTCCAPAAEPFAPQRRAASCCRATWAAA